MEKFLLNKEYKLQLKILDLLNATPTKEISFSELKTKLKLSKKTIENHVNNLLNYCRENHLETFTVEDNMLKMSSDTNFNLFNLYQDMIHQSIKYQIMSSVFREDYGSFTDLYLNLAISQSNLSVHIKQLNTFLETYNCQLNFHQKKALQGEEHQIRFFYHNLFLGLDDNTIIPTSDFERITNLLLEIAPQIPYLTLSKIRLDFYIFQTRSQMGHFVNSEKIFILPDSPYISYHDFFNKLNSIDFLDNCTTLKIKQKECRYLYFLFCCANPIPLKAYESSDFQMISPDTPSVQYFIDHFCQKSNLKLKNHEINFLYHNLYLLNKEAAVFTGRRKTFGFEKILDKLDNKRPNTSAFIKQFIQEIYSKNRSIKRLLDNYPNLYDNYIILLKSIIEKHCQPIKLLIQTNFSVLYREQLISQIVNAVPFPINVCTSGQLNDNKPDGIISNWKPEKKYQDVPFFSISLFYDDWNRSDLDCFLNQLVDNKIPLP